MLFYIVILINICQQSLPIVVDKIRIISVRRSRTVEVNIYGFAAPFMEKNINLIFVGWVERSETQH
jgi:hypothetical protein